MPATYLPPRRPSSILVHWRPLLAKADAGPLPLAAGEDAP
jgi:hypothetical protein